LTYTITAPPGRAARLRRPARHGEQRRVADVHNAANTGYVLAGVKVDGASVRPLWRPTRSATSRQHTIAVTFSATQTLLLHWKLDETSGFHGVRFLRQRHAGTAGQQPRVDGWGGSTGALSFTATSNYVSVATVKNLTAAHAVYTLATWIQGGRAAVHRRGSPAGMKAAARTTGC